MTRRAVLRLTVYREDDGRDEDMTWVALQSALYQIEGVKLVEILEKGAPTELQKIQRRSASGAPVLRIDHVIGTLAGIEALENLGENLKVQLTDEAVYEHLMTCVSVLDDDDDKARLRDLADFFAYHFCEDA